jgi:hypothetical protein
MSRLYRLLPLFALTPLIALTGESPAAEKEGQVYEMRVYYAPAGKLEALNARFKDHTMKLFEKHGITNVGYFVPAGENKENKLVYFISSPSKAAHEKAFKEFQADPDWKKAYAESEKDGKLVTKVDSTFLTLTDYSPALKVEKGKDERVFELRTYTASKGNLGNLNDRFKDHTIKLFEKHGMTNIAYWNVLKGQKGDDNKLVYLLAHKNQDARKKSFDEFGKDPEWIAARAESEKKGGGSLTEKNGVVFEFLVPTDYSPLK